MAQTSVPVWTTRASNRSLSHSARPPPPIARTTLHEIWRLRSRRSIAYEIRHTPRTHHAPKTSLRNALKAPFSSAVRRDPEANPHPTRTRWEIGDRPAGKPGRQGEVRPNVDASAATTTDAAALQAGSCGSRIANF